MCCCFDWDVLLEELGPFHNLPTTLFYTHKIENVSNLNLRFGKKKM